VTDRLILRVGSTDPTDKDNAGEDIDLEIDQNIDINNLTSASIQALFSKLPDGRYRIVWRRGTGTGAVTERTILDVLLRDGRPINFDDLEKPTVPSQPADMPESGSRIRQRFKGTTLPSDRDRPTLPVEDLAVLLNSQSAEIGAAAESRLGEVPVQDAAGQPSEESLAADADANRDNVDQRWSAMGAGLLPASVLLELAVLRKRWKTTRESANATPTAKAFSRADRLYRRLRKNSSQSLTGNSD
jgi:hypothetical protein